MKCPICDIEMRITEREGVEIDYCPQCRGVWLDRGELEKMIARLEPQQFREREDHDHDDHDDDDDHHRERSTGKYRDEERRKEGDYRHGGEYKHGGKRKEEFLSNLFDMFGD